MIKLISVLAILTFLSCSIENNNDWNKLISDPLYKQKFELNISNSRLIATRKVNPEKLYQKVDSYTSNLNYCDNIHKEKFNDQPYVIQLFENHCQAKKVSDKLLSKYPFYSSLTIEDFRDINDLYISTYLNGMSYYEIINDIKSDDEK